MRIPQDSTTLRMKGTVSVLRRRLSSPSLTQYCGHTNPILSKPPKNSILHIVRESAWLTFTFFSQFSSTTWKTSACRNAICHTIDNRKDWIVDFT